MEPLERPRKNLGCTSLKYRSGCEWIVLVMDYGNVDDDNVCSVARVIESAMVKVMGYPTEK